VESRSRKKGRVKKTSAAAQGPTTPRLYLLTPQLGDPAAFVHDIGPALQAGDVAAILLRLETAGERTLINRAKTVAAAVQRHDIALLLEGNSALAIRAGADGAHLTDIEALNGSIATLKPDRIAGAGGLRSRHDAMLAGEAGADYVMFGEVDARDRRPPFDAIEERLIWWSALFEMPCVGYAASLDEVVPLVRAGADFVALGDWIWTQNEKPAALIAQAGNIIAAAKR
jgi:thiamine-phosphate pyrophosphorylase